MRLPPVTNHEPRTTHHARSWRADWARLRGLENPRDGYADRYFNRYLSRPITLVLARTPVTPNQVTVLSGLVGIAAGLTIARGGYWAPVGGALLLQLSVVLDDVDGELARLTRRFSRFGELLDVTVDTLTHLAVFLGIAVAVARVSGPAALTVAGSLLASGVLASFALVTYLEQRVFSAGGATVARERLRRYVEILSGRDSSVVVLAFALAGRLDWFLWAAAVGAHAFWVSVLALWWRALAARQ
jgi:phosphatidylglycerophosphate synthase